MVQLQQPFNAHAVPPQSRPEPIDEGWYPAVMVASELKPTQANDGGYFELIFDVIDGPAKGRKLYARLNIYNSNEQAVQIAVGQLSAICWSVGVMDIQDTQQLHNIPLQVFVVKRKNERDGGYTNDIKGFRNINGNEPWKQQSGQQPQQQPQAQTSGQGPGQGWQNPSPGTPQPGGWQTPPTTAPSGPPLHQQPQSQFPQQGGNGQQQWGTQQQPQSQPFTGGGMPSNPPWQK